MFTLGIDFGSNSVRALSVECVDGAEFGSAVADYASGHQGVLLDPSDQFLARQHPADYLEGLVRDELIAANHAVYNELYVLYRDLHDSFGGLTHSADLAHVMKRLIEIKYAHRSDAA
ncbi:MAG: hypothetical protein P4L82_12795 [Ancalomicrobiaceae bacterium]|nr:hypothetical protein [Ancalomicrobiaceae bacterium]